MRCYNIGACDMSDKTTYEPTNLVNYIQTLDYLRWEFLRLSEQYRRDWDSYLREYVEENALYEDNICFNCEDRGSVECHEKGYTCEKTQDFIENPLGYGLHHHLIELWDVDTYYKKLKKPTIDLLMKYGIRTFIAPDLDYAAIMDDIDEKDFSLKDFKDIEGFITKIKTSKDKLSKYIRQRIPNTKDTDSFIQGLNQLLDDAAIRDHYPAELSEEASKAFQNYNLSGRFRHQNRVLLEEAFPDEIINTREHPKTRWYDRLIFYTYLHEFSIYEGVYPHVNYDESPFINLTINVSMRVKDAVNEFRRIISERRKEFFQRQDKSVGLKWSLPKGHNLENLQDTLEIYKQHLNGYPNHKIAQNLLQVQKGTSLPALYEETASNPNPTDAELRRMKEIEGAFEKLEYNVENRLRKANKIMANVVQGIFPDIE